MISISQEKNRGSGFRSTQIQASANWFVSKRAVAFVSLIGFLSVQLLPSLSTAQEAAKTTTAQKPVVPSIQKPNAPSMQTQGVHTGSTLVSVERGLERIERGLEPRTLAELHALEKQQEKVASEINKVTVNVKQGTAQGSGVIITADGFVLTAAHVAGKPGKNAKIVMSDGREVNAKTLGVNRSMDAGLLQIEDRNGRPWPHASLGKSEDLKLGQWLIAAGHPGGWIEDRPAVIRVGRLLQKSRENDTLVTDCALIGGDSGGPLFDLSGRLIGIHSRIGTETVENMHVPIDVFRESWNRLAASEAWGSLPGFRPMIGVRGVAGEMGKGPAKVGFVDSRSPAETAGIQPGDVIVRFNGISIATFKDLQRAVEETMPGDRIRIEFERGGSVLSKKIMIGVADTE